MHHIDLKHTDLRKFRRLKGTDDYVLRQRARVQSEKWDERWRRRAVLERHSEELLRHLPAFEAQRAQAARKTSEAQQAVASLAAILSKGLEAAPFRMEMLYDTSVFPEPRPVAPVDQPLPPAPKRSDPVFDEVDINPRYLWPLLLMTPKRRQQRALQLRTAASQMKFDLAQQDWLAAKEDTALQNAKAKALFEMNLDEWWARAQAFLKQQQKDNIKIDKFRLRYAQGNPDAVIEFLDAALSHADYPDIFPMRWEMGFTAETGALIIDYELPAPEHFPTLKSVKFDVLREDFSESHWSEAEVAQLYDSAILQTCLRVLHDLFAADEAEVVSYVTFNGWVNFTDKIRDTPARACILTVQADRNGIVQANLLAADPKAVFRRLKGLSGMKLSNLDPVVPIMWLERDHLAANDSIEVKLPSLSPSPPLVPDLAKSLRH